MNIYKYFIISLSALTFLAPLQVSPEELSCKSVKIQSTSPYSDKRPDFNCSGPSPLISSHDKSYDSSLILT